MQIKSNVSSHRSYNGTVITKVKQLYVLSTNHFYMLNILTDLRCTVLLEKAILFNVIVIRAQRRMEAFKKFYGNIYYWYEKKLKV